MNEVKKDCDTCQNRCMDMDMDPYCSAVNKPWGRSLSSKPKECGPESLLWQCDTRRSMSEPECIRPTSDGKRACLSLITRLDGMTLAVWHKTHNMWVLPGGKVDNGETLEDCQARELKEETGLVTVLASHLYDGDSSMGDGRRLFVFNVQAFGVPRETEEGSPVIWTPLEEIGISGLGIDEKRTGFYEGLLAFMKARQR